MGMFDSLFVECPNCGNTIELQSKAGDCILASYNIDSVPASVLADIAEKESPFMCYQCETLLRIRFEYVCRVERSVRDERSEKNNSILFTRWQQGRFSRAY
jgi:hypothetical protein